MPFSTDKQTLDDLNIIGKHGGDSIFDIYNRCTTRGGEAILEVMFRYPLSDERSINLRCGIIKSFTGEGIVFPFKADHLDAAEKYLGNTDARTMLSAQDHSFTKKLINLVALDAETALIYNGVNALIDITRDFYLFIKSLDVNNADFYQSFKELTCSIIGIPELALILKRDEKSKLSSSEIAAYDKLLRFQHREIIQRLLQSVYYLDVYISVAKIAFEKKWTFPKATSFGPQELTLEGVFHPQVNQAISNTIHITNNSNIIFLTGANMAGKSTFMKAISIALYAAHVGLPVAAERMEFSVLDGIYTTINLPDNLGKGASHFYAEVLRVKKIANELSQSKSLFIVFDELFRGTNVKDAYEATIALTQAFATRRNSIFIISTHIIEAGEVLKTSCENIRFKYLPTTMTGNTPQYTYHLQEGITDDRHGMVIIRNEGILEILKNGQLKTIAS